MSQINLDSISDLAIHDLRACYTSQGILAGNHHFTDYWARDGFFAAFGSLAIGDKEIAEQMVKFFFSFQRPDGLIPYRIMNGPMLSLSKYLGHPPSYSQPKPTYRLRGIGSLVLDGTTLSILFAALSNQTQLIAQIELGLKFLTNHEVNGLLWDGPMCEWNDAIWKWGNLLYSNIIYWYMYDRLASWQSTHNPSYSRSLIIKRDSIASSLRARLWNGQYFADWHDYKRQDYFYPFGNCLAIVWGLTTPQETTSILSQCHLSQIDFTLETNSPSYPWWRVDFLQRLAGMADYQNHGTLWWQTIAAFVLAAKQSNHLDLATAQLTKIATKVTRDQSIYECYERDGRPVKRTFYSSEHPFAWASGMILWAMTYNNSHAKH